MKTSEYQHDYYMRNKEAAAAQMAQWEVDNREARALRRAVVRKRNAAYVAAARTECLDCGETEKLHFHHIDPSTKTLAVASMASQSYSVARIQVEIDKCVQVCEPCHVIRHGKM